MGEQESLSMSNHSHPGTSSMLLQHLILITRLEGGGYTLWNHAEEVPCLQRDPSASQPSNVSHPLGGKGTGDTGRSVWMGWGRGTWSAEDAFTDSPPNKPDNG